MSTNKALEQVQNELMKNYVEQIDSMPNRSDEIKSLRTQLVSQIQANEGAEYKPKRLTVQLGNGNGGSRPYALRRPGEKLGYQAMFGSAAGGSWNSQGNGDGFFNAVFSGRHDPRLIQAGMTTTVPSDGGFLVPTETAQQIHQVSLESELVMPRAFVQPMSSNALEIPAMTLGSHAVSLFGGFQASYVAEDGEIPEKNPKFRQLELNAKKLTGLVRFSNELVQDMVGGHDQVVRICGEGLAWYRDRSFLKGNGAGAPLGILKAPCTITVAAESGQGANTIVYANLVNMMARLHAGSFSKSVWICHQSTIPQLLQMFVTHTDGTELVGSHVPVLREDGSGFKLLTRPVVFTEKTETLGSRGDIMLCDLSQYVVGLRSGMRFDTSIHAGNAFEHDQLLARLIERHDGMPLWSEALTLENGTTVSPFVTLNASRT